MPESSGGKIRIPVSGDTFDEIRTITISEDEGISALYGRKSGTEEWTIKTYLFDESAGWTIEKAQMWIDGHPSHQSIVKATQAEQVDIPEGTFEELPDLSRYITVRQHPPQHFTGYRQMPFHRTPAFHETVDTQESTRGILAALGVWKRTGARVIQKLHFERAKGWTEEKVEAWFQDHPTLYYPRSEGLFFALSDNSTESHGIVSDHVLATQYVSDGLSEDIDELDVIVIQGGWGKNKRRGPDGEFYQDYFPQRFLESLLPLLEETTVQSVKLTPESTGDMADVIQETIQELRQHGHPDDIANLLFRHGFAGNTIGFLTQAQLQGLDHDKNPYILARFVLSDNEAAQDSRRLLQSAWRHGLDRALGLSINYRASVTFTMVDGQRACMFEHATHHVSTELVPNPAAGGKILRPNSAVSVVQGEDTMGKKMQDSRQAGQEEEVVTKDITSQSSDQDASADDVVATQSAPDDTTSDEEKRTQDALSQHEDTRVSSQATQGVVDERSEKNDDVVLQRLDALTGTVQTLAGAVQGITKKQASDELTSLVTGNDALPQDAKTQILQQIAGGILTTPSHVQAMVAVAQATLPKEQEDAPPAPLFQGMAVQNATRAEVSRDRKDVMKIRSYKLWGLPLTQAEEALAKKYRIRPFLGIQDEYVQMTGDSELSFHGLNPATFIQNAHPEVVRHTDRYRGILDEVNVGANFAQTILTTTYSDFLTHILNRTLEIHFLNQDKTWERVVRRGESYSDNRDHTHFLLGQFPEIATVAQGADYQEMGSGKLSSVTSSNVKRGNLWKITEEVIQDDDLEYVKNSVLQIAMAANRTMEHQVWNFMFGASGGAFNGDTMTDSIAGALYSYDNRRNYINGSLTDYEKVVELIQLMLTQTDFIDDDGNTAPMTMMPNLFIGNIQDIGKIRAMAAAQTEPGRIDNLPNQFYMLNSLPDENFIGVHPQYMLDHPEFLGVLPNPALIPGLVLKYFRGMETPEFIWEGNQAPAYGSAFASDTLQLRVKFKYRLYYYKLKAFHGLFLAA